MKKSSKKELRSLARARNLAREALYRVMDENEHEWQLVRKLRKGYDSLFVSLWDKYRIDPKFVEKEFFECCEHLVEFIIEEHRTDSEFRKIYKPFYDNVQKLNKDYNRLKLQKSKKQGKRK